MTALQSLLYNLCVNVESMPENLPHDTKIFSKADVLKHDFPDRAAGCKGNIYFTAQAVAALVQRIEKEGELEKSLKKDCTDIWEERPASDFACGNVKIVMEDGSEPWRDKQVMKIIANATLTMGKKNWPLTPPTMRFGSELERLVKESMPCPDSISLRVREGMTRSDWVRGEWVCRHSDDGPLYENACYEDVAIESGGKVQALIKVRRTA